MKDVSADQTGPWSRLTTVLSQTVVISAVLYYFGWVRTQATWAFFGIDVSLLGFSPTDYALRSINATFLPLIGIGIGALLAVALHRSKLLPAALAAPATVERRRADVGIKVGYTAGVLLLAAVGICLLVPAVAGRVPGAVLPLGLLAATGLIAYPDQLRSARVRPSRRSSPARPGMRPVILTLLAVIGLLWTVAIYARQTGEQAALGVAAGLRSRPAVTMYSVHQLALSGPGIAVTAITQPDSSYKFRYTGLVSLIHTPDRHLLLAEQWRKGRDPVYVIPASDDIRIDVVAR